MPDRITAHYQQATPEYCRARRDRALKSVGLTVDDLYERHGSGMATPDEEDAMREVDCMEWLLKDLEVE